MRKSYIYADFPSGDITDRIVEKLKRLSLYQLSELINDGTISIPSKADRDMIAYELSYRNLRWYHIDKYAAATGASLREILYGDTMPERTHYSVCDHLVLPLLNVLPVKLLTSADYLLRNCFYNPKFDIVPEMTPSAKLMFIAISSWDIPPLVAPAESELYQTDINEELTRLREFRSKETYVIRLNYILDMCTYFHVSPHWAFSLSGTLFCGEPEADRFFDTFCLLPARQQKAALTMLLMLCDDAQCDIPADLRRNIKQFLSEGAES